MSAAPAASAVPLPAALAAADDAPAWREAARAGLAAMRADLRRRFDAGEDVERLVDACRAATDTVVREYCGHGIGRVYHEDPQVLHYGQPETGVVLQPGMTFTIEPMINEGSRHTRLLNDGWTVVTRDKSLSAQWEHTVAVTADGVEILTRVPGDDNDL